MSRRTPRCFTTSVEVDIDNDELIAHIAEHDELWDQAVKERARRTGKAALSADPRELAERLRALDTIAAREAWERLKAEALILGLEPRP